MLYFFKMENKKSYGLAIGGGGSLGAYAMGVWRALEELNITLTHITGTSIGALIGALMLCSDFETSWKIWETMTPSKIFKYGINLEYQELKKTFKNNPNRLRNLMRSIIQNKGVDISPFVRLMEKNLNLKLIKESPILFGVTAVSLPLFHQKDVLIQAVEEDQIIPWLLASSAVWPFFPTQEINGVQYIDGGVKENLPIDFALTLGAKELIVINYFPNWPGYKKYRNKENILWIEPSQKLGSIAHILDFRPRLIKQNMQIGYYDTIKKIGRFWGNKYTFLPKSEIVDSLGKALENLLEKEYPNQLADIYKQAGKKIKINISPQDLFIYTLEQLAAIFSLSPYKIYTVDELTKKLYFKLSKSLKKDQAIPVIRKIIDQHALTKKEEKLALSSLKYLFEHQINQKGIKQITLTKNKHILLTGFVYILYEHYRA